MTDFVPSSKVRELQAMLFPVQPIPGGALTSLQGSSELQASQLGRCEIPKRDESLFTVPLSVTRHRDAKEALRALLDARCVADGIAQEAARWPTECQVIPERVRHIEYNPATPEPFYTPTGKEPRPKPICDELGSVVFNYCPISVTNYFSRSCVGGSTVLPFPTEFSRSSASCVLPDTGNDSDSNNLFFVADACRGADDSDNDLHFESRFECGNLGKVVKITDTYYQLYLRRDLYTQRHTQWYYFRISNTRSRITYRLSIVNLCKEDSLYNEGLKPLLYSTEDARTRAVGWRRCGDNITYYRNNDSSDEEKEKHTLTFNVSFPHDRDTVYLAHCYPYTYTDLQEYLAKIAADPAKARFAKLRLLCRTLAGNSVYYLTITAPAYDDEVRRKRGVVVTARVHPGETPSSWTMKGIIDFLTGESDQARELRERFVFKLVPMLNPDGVIVGNNRCSLSGKDLNRQYRTVMRESYPSVWHTKLMIRRLLEECGVAIYCDLHAHSRKHNIFAYGCESKRSGCYARLSEQVFPLMLHKNAADKFSFENCKFHVEKGKEGTGRVVVWSMGVQNSYTMEASMGGSKMGSRSGTHFTTQDYEQIGKAFCETLLDFSDQDPTKERLRIKIVARLVKEGSSAEEPTNIDLTDYSSDEGDTSDSSTSQDDKTELPNNGWMSEDKSVIIDSYPSVPPSTPTFVVSGRSSASKKKIRKGTATERSYLERKKLLARRTVMDLPTTDPGSDLCDLTDSADEGLLRGGRGTSSGIRRHVGEESINNFSEREDHVDGRQERSANCLILPAIVRPRSVSFAEDLYERKEHRTSGQRSQWSRLTRLRTTQDVQVKLTSLRQQIWMGVQPFEEDKDDFGIPFARSPLSWGISNLALTRCHVESELLLRSCSKKLQSLEARGEPRRVRKKCRRKRVGASAEVAPEVDEAPQEEPKLAKMKRARSKWQRAANMKSDTKEVRPSKSTASSVKTEELKAVKLVAVARPQPRPQRPEPKRKFRRGGIVAVTTTTVGKAGKSRTSTQVEARASQTRLFAESCDSTSSDDASGEWGKGKSDKKKQRKKKAQLKKPKTAGVTARKRASSAKALRSVT